MDPDAFRAWLAALCLKISSNRHAELGNDEYLSHDLLQRGENITLEPNSDNGLHRYIGLEHCQLEARHNSSVCHYRKQQRNSKTQTAINGTKCATMSLASTSGQPVRSDPKARHYPDASCGLSGMAPGKRGCCAPGSCFTSVKCVRGQI